MLDVIGTLLQVLEDGGRLVLAESILNPVRTPTDPDGLLVLGPGRLQATVK